jgi:hypothetical protein
MTGSFMLRATILIAFFLMLPGGGAEASSPSLSIPRVSGRPKIEDFINKKEREAEIRVSDFRQYVPGDGAPASRETTAYLSYDEENLYIIFECKEEPQSIRARMSKREDIFSDDQVSVFLDTFHDRQRGYMFGVNPLGIQMDNTFTEGKGPDFSFDTLWHSEGRLTEDGYVVLMSIPFKSLRFSSEQAQTWGIALGRFIPRTNEICYWPYITQRLEGFAQQMATLNGLERISPGRNIQVIPYGAIGTARFLDTNGSPGPRLRTDNEVRGGVDTKIVLHDAFTIDMTLNPDFSQVESDEPQVTVNQRFEVFFPEKRPFFIENAALFETPENLFFSRRIANPQLGVRLTGKLQRWTFAGLAIDDRAPGKLVDEGDPLFGRRASSARIRPTIKDWVSGHES